MPPGGLVYFWDMKKWSFLSQNINRTSCEGPVVPNFNDTKPNDRFPGLWKQKPDHSLIPQCEFAVFLYDSDCPSLKAKVRKQVSKKWAIEDELNVEVIDVDKAEDITSILNIFKQFWEVEGGGVKNVK